MNTIQKENIKHEKRRTFRIQISYLLLCLSGGLNTFPDTSLMYYFKDILKISPFKLSLINALKNIPIIIQPLYGIITDKFPIFGYRRKNYIILIGTIQALLWLIMLIVPSNLPTSLIALFSNQICLGFEEVVTQAIAVQLTKKQEEEETDNVDKKDNVSRLIIFRIIGTILAQVLNTITLKFFHIKIVFSIQLGISFMAIISGFILYEQKLEDKKDINEIENLVANNVNFKNFLNIINNRKIIIPLSLLIVLSSMPYYQEVSFYYLTEVKNYPKVFYGIFGIFLVIFILLFTMIYSKFFQKLNKKYLIITLLFISFMTSMIYYFYVSFNWDSKFLIMLSFASHFILIQLEQLPFMKLGAYLSPENYEGSVYSLFFSGKCFGTLLSTLIGTLLISIFKVQKGNYGNLKNLVLASNLFIIVPIIMVTFVKQKYLNFQKKKIWKKI